MNPVRTSTGSSNGVKLLVVTQTIDQDDPILGFFHGWVAALATRIESIESIEVICLRQGRHALPANVHVHSLGKEKTRNRFLYVWRFWVFIWSLGRNYDRVLVHMNPEYLILGGLDWWVMGKRVSFWYNHPHDDWRLRIASWFAQKVFYTSPYAATAKMKKAIRMPAGIDTEVFKPQVAPHQRQRHALYMQGRIMPSKRVDIALRALRLVREKVRDAVLVLVGPEDVTYGKKLRDEFADLIHTKAVVFGGPEPYNMTPLLYSSYGISINLAARGHYDKSVLESIACGTPVVLSSHAFDEYNQNLKVVDVPNLFVTKDESAESVSEMVLFVLENYDRWDAERARQIVVEKESLEALAAKLVKNL